HISCASRYINKAGLVASWNGNGTIGVAYRSDKCRPRKSPRCSGEKDLRRFTRLHTGQKDHAKIGRRSRRQGELDEISGNDFVLTSGIACGAQSGLSTAQILCEKVRRSTCGEEPTGGQRETS